MLTAHANTTSEDFLVQLRTYVIALGCSEHVVDCVDRLSGTAEETKAEILKTANDWLEYHEARDLIKAPCEALIKAIENA